MPADASDDDAHAPLRRDIRLLGDLLGQVLREQEGDAFFDTVESVRRAAKEARAEGFQPAQALAERLQGVPAAEAGKLARAFGQFLSLANIAEQHHRIRRRRDHMRQGSAHQRASLPETFERLLAAHVSPAALRKAVLGLRIDLILTAHPTEATPRTILLKMDRVASLLERLDRPDLLDLERDAARRALHGEITAWWLTAAVRRRRPTPESEARGGLAVVERVLWHAVPRFLRELDVRLHKSTGGGLPLDAVPIRFGSWMGGDRDGNPHVTADVTRRVMLLSRWMALHLYVRDLDALRQELSVAAATPAFRQRAGDAAEPYRAVLRELRARLRGDLEATAAELEGAMPKRPAVDRDELMSTLAACYDSLHDVGAGAVADGNLLDTLRRVACFGLHLLPLDIRQEADRHTEALDHLTQGEYDGWDEAQRTAFLLDGLDEAAGLAAEGDDPGPVREVLDTFRMLAAADRDGLGAYVISMAARASDVLAVAYLQRRAGVEPPLPVVPLFETPADLARAPDVVAALLDDPRSRGAVARDGVQVMIGYSDSAKEAGMLSAAWALYAAQERIGQACRERGVPLTLFHGRGGSVGRGGGPAHQAIAALPPGAVSGRLRVTEQGEVIQARFGLPGIALRTLELYATGVLEATLAPPAPPEPAWRDAMERLADVARESYSKALAAEGFVPYFCAVTPVEELEGLNIGSRPARRGAATTPASLRAIPWVFAWTQDRLLLPAWLGADEALAEAPPEGMRGWPFWQTTLDLLEMALAKADPDVFAYYDQALAPHDGGIDWGERLLARLATARHRVRDASGHDALLASTPVLQRSIRVRNPYVDPIHLLQVQLLKRLRAGDEDARGPLLETMTGIAAGMRNTG